MKALINKYKNNTGHPHGVFLDSQSGVHTMPVLKTCRTSVLLAGIVVLFSIQSAPAEPASSDIPAYKNAALSIDARVDDLLSRMTLNEKVAQMRYIWLDKVRMFDRSGHFVPGKAKSVIPYGIGQITRPSDKTGIAGAGAASTRGPKNTVELVNAIQRYAVNKTRLGIPVTFNEEGLHGFAANKATSFPQAIALASSWSPALIEQVFSIAARELRANGVQQVLAPVVDVARDPRWGRIEETFGEDPYLVSEMGVAAVRGFQGDSLPLKKDKVFATLKHMTGHGQPESGTNTAPAVIGDRVLHEVFLPPFEAAVRRTSIMNVMPSYNEIDGIPSHVNSYLLTELLRNQWGFKGIVVSDYYAVMDLIGRHRLAGTPASAALQALYAGVDTEISDPNAYSQLVYLVKKGILDEALIDRSVRRVLRAKFLAGLFEQPYADAEEAESITNNAEAREVALEAARKSAVLLKNDNELLPLDISKLKKIAVIGPNAADIYLGGYSTMPPDHSVSVLQGIRNKVGNRIEVAYAEGVRITEEHNWWADKVVLTPTEENTPRIAEAVATAKNKDAVILVIGGNEQTSREAWSETHMGDRAGLDLLGDQNKLVKAILETGVPTVVVLINGRPLSARYVAENVPAILEAWYLGQATGTAVADILFGDVNPGGKLPVSIARSAGHLPVFYNYKPSARRGYLADETAPLYPFGHGLSYTNFKISKPRLTKKQIKIGETTEVSVQVKNSGRRTGDEVVQLYIRDVLASVTRPVMELKGFKRITLKPGESENVTLQIKPEHLQFYNRQMQRVIEPGEFEIMVGSSSADTQSTVLQVSQ